MFSNWFSTKDKSVDSQHPWINWYNWQKDQPPAHYESSAIMRYYVKYYGWPEASRNVLKEERGYLYRYCFGDFTALITNFGTVAELPRYIYILLKIYDAGKGISRKFYGDPPGIAMMRKVLEHNNWNIVYEYDYNPYNYNPAFLHAHTVAAYSLSTLILRLLSHYLRFISDARPYINIKLCAAAYENSRFGSTGSTDNALIRYTADDTIVQRVASPAIDIPATPVAESSLSCPQNRAAILHCSKCHRLTEKMWGAHKLCLDCHMKNTCSICGSVGLYIAHDGLPRCRVHAQNTDLL